jgi:hypothetical protein
MIFELKTLEHQQTAIQSVVEVTLYTSFAPLVLFWSFYGDSEPFQRWDGNPTEMSQGFLGVLTEVYASGNVCSSAIEVGFVGLRTCVHGLMNLCSFSKAIYYYLSKYPIDLHDGNKMLDVFMYSKKTSITNLIITVCHK